MSAVAGAEALSAQLTVLGSGSWGTALAIQAARIGRAVVLWGRSRAQLTELARDRRNARYLPNASFPDSLRIESDLHTAVRASRDVLIAVPSHALRDLVLDLAPHLANNARVAWATKGFELADGTSCPMRSSAPCSARACRRP